MAGPDRKTAALTMTFDRAVTVITGAGSGIGRACAVRLARRGAIVVATDVDVSEAARTAELITAEGHTAKALALDVRSTEHFAAVRDSCLSEWGRVDAVMNNVGVVAVGLPEDLPMTEWQRTIDLNLLSIVRSNEVFLPLLIGQEHGLVVNTASTSGLFPYSYDRLAYTATKAAVVALTEALALYLRPHGVQVSCVCPAGVRTNIGANMTHYGRPRPLGVPALPVVTADAFAETVVDGLENGQFLICSVPEAYTAVASRGADVDANLEGAVARYGWHPATG